MTPSDHPADELHQILLPVDREFDAVRRYAADVAGGSRVVGLLFVISVFGCAFLASPAEARWGGACGSVREHYRDQGGGEYILAVKVVGREVGCRTARKVAHAYASRSHYARTRRDRERTVRNRFPRAVGRFRCSAEYLGSDIRAIACRDGDEEVSFDWYDSSGYH